MKIFEKILFLFILVLLLLPAVQKEFHVFHEKELHGDFQPTGKPTFSWGHWYAGSFQDSLDQYVKDSIGFHASLVRIYNQIDYSLFNTIHANGVVSGKGGQLFEYDYIRAHTGIDYLGEALIDIKMRRLKFVQRYLKDSLDIDLIFILEPGKVSFYPEFVKEKYLENQKAITNYQCIKEKAEFYNIDHVDFNSWFKLLKPNAPYPLYPQHGTHWSQYGMSVVADSLLNLIGNTRGITMRKAWIDTISVEEVARPPDYDIASAMNLVYRLKENQPLAYPSYRFEGNAENKDYPMVLVVGDSYYWNIVNSDIPKELFKNEAFWYFGKLVYPDFYYNPTYVADLDIQKEVEKQEVILLMSTERFLYKFDWQFIDKLYSIYGVTSRLDRLYYYTSQILSNDEWFSDVIEKAKMRNTTLEEMLMLNAKYTYYTNEPFKYNIVYCMGDFEEKVRNDQSRMEEIARKAGEKNISLEEMIAIDAEYTLAESIPEEFQIHQMLQKKMDFIRNDSVLREATQREADFYYLNFDEMLWIKAEQLLGEIIPDTE